MGAGQGARGERLPLLPESGPDSAATTSGTQLEGVWVLITTWEDGVNSHRVRVDDKGAIRPFG